MVRLFGTLSLFVFDCVELVRGAAGGRDAEECTELGAGTTLGEAGWTVFFGSEDED